MCHLANVLRVYNEAHGVLEVKPPTTLDLVGSNQFLSCPMVISLFESLCPAPHPPVSDIGANPQEFPMVMLNNSTKKVNNNIA